MLHACVDTITSTGNVCGFECNQAILVRLIQNGPNEIRRIPFHCKCCIPIICSSGSHSQERSNFATSWTTCIPNFVIFFHEAVQTLTIKKPLRIYKAAAARTDPNQWNKGDVQPLGMEHCFYPTQGWAAEGLVGTHLDPRIGFFVRHDPHSLTLDVLTPRVQQPTWGLILAREHLAASTENSPGVSAHFSHLPVARFTHGISYLEVLGRLLYLLPSILSIPGVTSRCGFEAGNLRLERYWNSYPKSQLLFKIKRQPKKLRKPRLMVRIAPNELHINHPDASQNMAKVGWGFTKNAAFYEVLSFPGFSIIETASERHRILRQHRWLRAICSSDSRILLRKASPLHRASDVSKQFSELLHATLTWVGRLSPTATAFFIPNPFKVNDCFGKAFFKSMPTSEIPLIQLLLALISAIIDIPVVRTPPKSTAL
ncbi:uncharacterized protein BDR25DRAFT_362981 [Lindgomyces ingoldianus]|uniref:Uncharacterized protein n=1 Tax=Lindgomyces ingoldianus TaxID=673940 RepID=A0ACB6Q8N3_9PLEO|nr:uncharacterized protein BDR25DRAFT_362981 [Lindgomyces ingoldianus]KAF2463254.1 hypothetical protein BDR25DRAFT_362981 [Lindgomyces ingoldianus]